MTNAIKALAQWKGSIPQDGILDFVLKVILALIVYFIGTKLIGWLCKNLRKHLVKFGSDEAAKSFLLSGIKIGLHLILILTIAGNLGVDKTSVAALVGSAGVAISLALQEMCIRDSFLSLSAMLWTLLLSEEHPDVSF